MKGPTNSSARPNIRLMNVSATFESNPDTSTNTEFPYRASVTADGVTQYMSAIIIYSQAQCISGAYSTYCQTYDGGVYLYAKTDVGTQTIPAISCDLSVNYINVDNVPTENSQAVITSGGVYDAIGGNRGTDTKPIKFVNGVATAVGHDLMTVDTQQTITATKIHKYPILVQSDNTDPFIMITSAYPRFAGKNPSNLASTDGMLYQMFGYDSRDKNYIQIDAYRRGTYGLSELHHYVKNESGGASDLCVFMNDSGTGWVQAPYRTFNTSNSADIVTIGSLLPSNGTTSSANIIYYKSGRIVTVIIRGLSVSAQGDQLVATGLPVPQGAWQGANYNFAITDPSGSLCTLGYINYQGYMYVNSQYATVLYGSTTYII